MQAPVPQAMPAPAAGDAGQGGDAPFVALPPAPIFVLPEAPPPGGEPGAPDVVIRARSSRGDPAMKLNAATFNVTQSVDKGFVAPVTRAYKKVVPSPFRSALRNFLGNLREPVVFVNYLLQLKPGKAAETLGRFAINSTIGLAGTMDVAKKKPFRLPQRRNSFANTLGYYGVGPGPFLFLPLIGPTSVRDLFGVVFDQAVVPIAPVQPLRRPEYAIPVGALSALDYRDRIDPEVTAIQNAVDPYAAARANFLRKRELEIGRLHGRKKVKPPKVVPTLP